MTKTETVRALNDSGPQLQTIEAVRAMRQETKRLRSQLEQLAPTVEQVRQSIERVNRSAESLRPSALRRMVELTAAGLIGALLVSALNLALDRLAHDDEKMRQQHNAAWMEAVWERATPEEREQIQQIRSRRP